MTRATRQASKAATRERLLGEARRLFRERGYAATSLEQIADAAGVTKGAIYGHFSSKEHLLISAIEAAPLPTWATAMNDGTLTMAERLTRFTATMAENEAFRDKAQLATELEFLAALLRSPEALRAFSAVEERRLAQLAESDPDQPLPGTSAVEVWAIGYALLTGLQIHQHLVPGVLTPAVFERAFRPLLGLYPEEPAAGA